MLPLSAASCMISLLLLASRARVTLYGLGSKSKSAGADTHVSPSHTPMTPLDAPAQPRCTVVKHGVLCLTAALSPRRPLTRRQSVLHLACH
ncbi:hypothetical protein C8R45DRAFT_508384 [Mycena sanguinolenta]|nr:hypothetical protein C8R45DRAFT_508384 [Mycena sanguinolenta]